MTLLKLRLINNSTIDLYFPDEELSEELDKLGEVMTDPLSLYTVPMGEGSSITVPGRNIVLIEVKEQEEDEEQDA